MNRTELQKLSKLRIKDAKVLLDDGCYEASYYLAGYAVECAIKACIAKQTKRYDFPPDRRMIDKMYTHHFQTLLQSADLWSLFVTQMNVDVDLRDNWDVIKKWSVDSRYELNVTKATATELYMAITDRKHGVLTWLKRYW
jgi:HEPN domain-containing protein